MWKSSLFPVSLLRMTDFASKKRYFPLNNHHTFIVYIYSLNYKCMIVINVEISLLYVEIPLLWGKVCLRRLSLLSTWKKKKKSRLGHKKRDWISILCTGNVLLKRNGRRKRSALHTSERHHICSAENLARLLWCAYGHARSCVFAKQLQRDIPSITGSFMLFTRKDNYLR